MLLYESTKNSPDFTEEQVQIHITLIFGFVISTKTNFQRCWLFGMCPRWEAFTVDPKQKCVPECYNNQKEMSNAYRIATRECSPEWRKVKCEDKLGGYNYTLVPCDDIPPCPKVSGSF